MRPTDQITITITIAIANTFSFTLTTTLTLTITLTSPSPWGLTTLHRGCSCTRRLLPRAAQPSPAAPKASARI